MKFTSFIPAFLAFACLASAQSPDLIKRDRSNVNAVIDLFVEAHTKLALDACAKITADICADVDVELTTDTNVLGGLITSKIDVEKLRLSAKTKIDVDIKAKVDAEVKAKVVAPIKAIVDKVVVDLCPLLENECIKKNAAKIVARVNADVQVKIRKLFLRLRANIPLFVRLRVKAIVREICIHAGIVESKITARVFIASNIKVHIKACLDLWVKLCAKVKLISNIQAL